MNNGSCLLRIGVCILCVCVLLIGAGLSLAESLYHIEDGFLAGSIVIDEVEFKLDALFDDSMALPHRYVQIVPPPIKAADIQSQIDMFFEIDDDFKLDETRAGWFIFCSTKGRYIHDEAAGKSYHMYTPTIEDKTLRDAVQKCKSFLDSLGVHYYPIPTFVAYGDIQENDGWGKWVSTTIAGDKPMDYVIRFANVVDGMAVSPFDVGNKGSMSGFNPERVMTDNPYTEFYFHEDGALGSLFLHTFEVTGESLIEEPILTWQESLTKWLFEYKEDENISHHLNSGDIYIIRIQAVWLTSYKNVLRPGWFIEMQIRDRETGIPVVNESGITSYIMTGIDALTGET